MEGKREQAAAAAVGRWRAFVAALDAVVAPEGMGAAGAASTSE